LVIGFLWGAFVSASLARQFALRLPPTLELIKAIVAGIFMGIGSALAMGSNIEGFFVALHNLAASGFLMMIGLIIGVRLGVSYLFWELEHLPCGGGFEIGFQKISPYLGILALVGLFVATDVYFGSELVSDRALGGCLIISAGIGFVMHRSRICMANALREPFMFGRAETAKALSIAIILGAIGIAILKYQGIRPEMMNITPTFGAGAVLGGLLFGVGMVLAGGCGAGILWRAAEGQLKLWVVTIVFALSNSIAYHLLTKYNILEKGYLGKALYLPNYLGYKGALYLIVFVMIIAYLIVDWKEETHRFARKI
jgi:uncharacterized membrane protein YedE/YeeE